VAALAGRFVAGKCWQRLGYARAGDYARERLGIARSKAFALLRLERSRSAAPELHAAYAAGQLSWVQAQALLPVVLMSPSRAADWIAWAGQVTVRRLRDDLDRAVLLAERDAEAFARTGGLPEAREGCEPGESGRVQTRANNRDSDRTYPPARLRTARVFFTATADVARLFRAAVCTVQRRVVRIAGRMPGGVRFELPLAAYGPGELADERSQAASSGAGDQRYCSTTAAPATSGRTSNQISRAQAVETPSRERS